VISKTLKIATFSMKTYKKSTICSNKRYTGMR